MFSALLNTQLHSRFTPIPGYGTDFTIPVGQADYNAIHALPEPLKGTVLGAFSDSFRVSLDEVQFRWTISLHEE